MPPSILNSRTVAFAAPPDPGVAESLTGRPGVRVVVHPPLEGPGLAAAATSADVLVVRSWQQVTREVLEAGAAGRLVAVVQGSAGLDNIDQSAASALGIRVLGVDPGNATAVAELTLMSIVALLRRIREHWARTARGEWPDRELLSDGEARGRTLGLIGLGRVGSRVARRARAFEMEVLAYDPYISDNDFAERAATRAAVLDELLPRCHVLSLHCPLTDETRGMIGATQIARLPRGALLVNTARGAVVDSAALVAALDTGQLAGAALDVFPVEPPAAGGVLVHPRVLPTPHLGGHTAESHRARAANMIDTLADLLAERP